jgi:hypothetical protein
MGVCKFIELPKSHHKRRLTRRVLAMRLMQAAADIRPLRSQQEISMSKLAAIADRIKTKKPLTTPRLMNGPNGLMQSNNASPKHLQ